jgi:enediyne biosynthesis protein E4
VLVRYTGKVQAQWVTSQSSFLSANDPRLHFGQGTAAKVSVEVHWPLAQSES